MPSDEEMMKTFKAYDMDGCGAVSKKDMRRYLRVKLGHEEHADETEKIAPQTDRIEEV